ncbi:MAG: sensor histidine kinase [Cyanobacteria bacterium P01_G01_bin.19]
MSKDIGTALLAKSEVIIESWVASIRHDLDIESAKGLAYKSVRNSIPSVLQALATLLSSSLSDKPQKLENNGLEHGIIRAEQGYDIAEIMQEYGSLRDVVLDVLEPDLLTGSTKEVLAMIKLIDSTIDRAIALSLESFVEVKLRELEQVQAELILSNQELTRLIAAQKEDLAHMAHELKSPLNSIMGFSELLLQQQKKITQAKDTSLNLKLTQTVINNSKQLLRLINDTLEISRYESGKIQLNLEPVDISSLIATVTEAFEPSAREKELEIILDCSRAPQCVNTDTIKVRQIITNLVSNAIRYTESGTITVICQTDGQDRWSIVVVDTGIGISDEAQAQIFEPYFRAGARDSESLNSTGLGLAIVDKLVKLLQGEVRLESRLNQGSRFTVNLPINT